MANITKGPLLEEALRAYFLKAGYYVVRGVPFIYEGFDVTDIDTWIYGRASSVSREISIIDIKNKKTPQAIERIFWVNGLKNAIGADRAIVATTDRREEVKQFGRRLGVLVLDGTFLSKLQSRDVHLVTRLSDEEFFAMLSDYSLSKLDGDWKGRITRCKALLAHGLSFDICIELLAHGRFFAEQAAASSVNRHLALRCLYLVSSYLAVAVDYELREISFAESGERAKLLAEGFTYGSKGRIGLDKMLELATGLVAEFANEGRSIANQVRAKVGNSLAGIPTSILGDYFGRRDVLGSLFGVARELEELAMARSFLLHTNASNDLRSLLGCLLDYWGIDRTHLLISSEPASGIK
jgi:hypothetical protein